MEKERFYMEAINIARQNNQTVGEKKDYYLTLQQIEELLKEIENINQPNINKMKDYLIIFRDDKKK